MFELPSADDDAFVASMAGSGWDAARALARVDVAGLSAAGRVDALVACQRVMAWAEASSLRVLAAMVADPSDEEPVDRSWAREDVQAALGISGPAAAGRLATAQELVTRLPDTVEAMEAGFLDGYRARVVAEATWGLPDQAADVVQSVALAKAGLPVASFRRAVARAVAALDPVAVEQSRVQGVADRRVVVRAESPGIASLYALLPAEDAAAVLAAVQSIADAAPLADPVTGEVRTADQRRADALTDLATGHVTATDDRSTAGATRADRDRRPGPAVQVTVALSTLLGLDDQLGELAGHGPIPASLARAIAADERGTWRRLVTDDRGILLDHGRATYRPPAGLRRFVQARDRTCRFIGCSRPARRCEVDHLQRWVDGGATSSDNLHALSKRHHIAKDEHAWRPRRRPDGVTEWRSPTGHHYTVPPDTYPLDPTLQPAGEPPPF